MESDYDLSSSEGIYIFGGINKKGELQSKLRHLRVATTDGQVKFGEWVKVNEEGQGPCPRIGHTMSYLPVTNALLVVSGRNDEICKSEQTPYLSDIFLYLLEQETWIQVKHTSNSHKMDKMSYHTACVIANQDNNYEKILIFGGV